LGITSETRRSGKAFSATRPRATAAPRRGHAYQRFPAPASVSVRKSGIDLSYTWCMGGITFFLFLSRP